MMNYPNQNFRLFSTVSFCEWNRSNTQDKTLANFVQYCLTIEIDQLHKTKRSLFCRFFYIIDKTKLPALYYSTHLWMKWQNTRQFLTVPLCEWDRSTTQDTSLGIFYITVSRMNWTKYTRQYFTFFITDLEIKSINYTRHNSQHIFIQHRFANEIDHITRSHFIGPVSV